MSQKTKTISVAGKSVTFTEIPMTTILSLFRGETPVYNVPLSSALAEFANLIPLAIDCPLDDLLDLELYSDDFQQIEAAFKETNPGFFDIARQLDLLGALKEIVKAIIGAYCSNMRSLQNMVIAASEVTASDSSLT